MSAFASRWLAFPPPPLYVPPPSSADEEYINVDPIIFLSKRCSYLKLCALKDALDSANIPLANEILQLLNPLTQERLNSFLKTHRIPILDTNEFQNDQLLLAQHSIADFQKALVCQKLAQEALAVTSQQTQSLRPKGFSFSGKTFVSRKPLRNESEEIPLGGIFSTRGARGHMQDAGLVKKWPITLGQCTEEARIYGVFDGHGKTGECAADHVKQHLAPFLDQALKKYNPDTLSDEGIFAALKETFSRLDATYTGEGGTTACLALILKNTLFVATVGDSRAAMYNERVIQQLSRDQTCSDPEFIRGVEKRGGWISPPDDCAEARVEGTLAIPRAIGDHDYFSEKGSLICPTPKITKWLLTEINPQAKLIIASDGLWGWCSTQECGAVLAQHESSCCQDSAQLLTQYALHQGSTDNIFVIVASVCEATRSLHPLPDTEPATQPALV